MKRPSESGRTALRRSGQSISIKTATVTVLALIVAGRFIVNMLSLPSVTYFALFAVLIAIILALPRASSRFDRRLDLPVGLVGLSVLASMAVNQSEPVAAVTLWLNLVAPFLALATFARLRVLHLVAPRDIQRLVGYLFWGQLAVVTVEVLAGSREDDVRGFLQGQGAAAHVVGFMYALTLLLYLGLRFERRVKTLPAAVILVGCLFAIVATSTNQALILCLVGTGAIVVVRMLNATSVVWIVVPSVLFAVLLASWHLLPVSQVYAEDFRYYKATAARTIGVEYEQAPELALFGLGPGETLTRVAWVSLVGGGTLTEQLGVRSGGIAAELYPLDSERSIYRQSSFTSVFYSWGGIVGDLGLVGTGVYLASWVLVVKSVRGGSERRSVLVLVGGLLLLGFFYNWLEEPVLTTYAAMLIAWLMFDPSQRGFGGPIDIGTRATDRRLTPLNLARTE